MEQGDCYKLQTSLGCQKKKERKEREEKHEVRKERKGGKRDVIMKFILLLLIYVNKNPGAGGMTQWESVFSSPTPT